MVQILKRGAPKKVLRLINNRTKAFRSISEILFVFDKQSPNLGFDILFFSIEWKLRELCELKDKNALHHETKRSMRSRYHLAKLLFYLFHI